MNIESDIRNDIDNLIEQYEQELEFLYDRNMKKFDTSKVPKIIQDMIKLAVAKSNSFSNISALTVANFVLSHTFGQVRPHIDDPIYSDDAIGINSYNLLISKSGSGKDSTYQVLMKAVKSSLEYVQDLQKDELEDKARKYYISTMKKDNPDFDESTVTRESYKDLIKPLEMPITSLSSSRGGLTSSLNKMSKNTYLTKSLFASEVGLAIQSNSMIVEVLELFSVLFDMGRSVAPEFKTQDAKEEPVEGMYVNLLGISSPTPFYQENGNVRKLLVPMMTTSLARRTTIVFSNGEEEFENMYIPSTPAEKRAIKAENRVIIKEYTNKINDKILEATKSLVNNKTIMFDEEAAIIYDDYKSYTEEVSKRILLKDSDSVEGIEMAGRAFKMARIAAIWTIAQNKQIIDKDTLIGAIYFSDYTAQHLIRFTKTLNLKDYELFINDWKSGYIANTLSLDKAITKGYINIKQVNTKSINNFLEPVNSKLKGEATVTYNGEEKIFIFKPIEKVNGEYSYRVSRGHKETLDITKEGMQIDVLSALLINDCVFNPIVNNQTKFIVLSVENSVLSIDLMNKYLENIQYFINTKEDEYDKHSFTLILPLNAVITDKEYKYVCLSIATQLLLKVKPEDCEITTLYKGYKGIDKPFTNKPLFDVTGIKGNFAAGVDIPKLPIKLQKPPTAIQIKKYIDTEILENKQDIVNYLNITNMSLITMAGLVYEMKMNYIDNLEIEDVIDNINVELDTSIRDSIKKEYILQPFEGL